jgi:hypothetical protein
METLFRCIVTAMSDQMKQATNSPKISPMNAGRSLVHHVHGRAALALKLLEDYKWVRAL